MTKLKVILLLLTFSCLSVLGYTQCNNSTQFPASTIQVSVYNTPKLIAVNNYAGDYANISQLADLKTYMFTSSNTMDYLTLRTNDNNTVLAHGPTPLSYTSAQNDLTVNLHINTSSSCGIESSARETNVTCVNCDPEPGKTGINTENPQAVLDINGELRVGETALPPQEGMIQYNSDLSKFRGYSDSEWKSFGHIEDEPFENSAILINSQQIRINQWVGNVNQKWERCYQKSVDGSTANDFHTNCDAKGPSVTVVELDNGRIFGAYSGVPFTSNNSYKRSSTSFLFSIDSDKKYPIAEDLDFSIYDHANYGPTFGGGHDIHINTSINLQYVNFPFTYARDGTFATPSNVACQELAGINISTPATITELEVWVKTY